MNGKERLNQWNWKDYVKNTVMLASKVPLWMMQACLLWKPLKKNRIAIYSLKQHGYSCNLKYLTEYLREHHPEQFEMLWIVRHPEDLEALKKRGVPAVLLHDKAHFRFRMQAKFVVTNDEFYPVFFKRPGQIYVNTWHGAINYKKIGYEGLEFTNPIQKLIYRMNNPCPDLFVSGSRSFTETASQSFGFPKGVFLESGLPRNDVLCGNRNALKMAVKKRLGIPAEKKVLLYAPTFRKGGFGVGQELDERRLCQTLSQRFGGDWMVLLRQHYFVSQRQKDLEGVLLDVSGHEDMQELIACADCLISDYSSCMWDFLLTGNPVFVYAPDLASYTAEDRSFFIPVDQWPYPMAQSQEELDDVIRGFDPADFAEKTAAHRAAFGSHDQGHACQMLTEAMMKYL